MRLCHVFPLMAETPVVYALDENQCLSVALLAGINREQAISMRPLFPTLQVGIVEVPPEEYVDLLMKIGEEHYGNVTLFHAKGVGVLLYAGFPSVLGRDAVAAVNDFIRDGGPDARLC